jgi:hypothetical protein
MVAVTKDKKLQPKFHRKSYEDVAPSALTSEMWGQIIGGLPHPAGYSAEQIIAMRVLMSLDGYRDLDHFRRVDRETIANVLVAYGRLMHDVGLRP